MAHTNYGELRQLFETFTRVWEAGGNTSLHLHTLDGQARATLDIQLGPPADPRPEAPDVRGEGPCPSHGPQHHVHVRCAPDDVDLLPEPETKCVARPGSRRKKSYSSQLLLTVIVTQIL